MTEEKADRSLPRLGRYLVSWFAGCAILMVVAYTALLEYYFELGIDLRTLALLEQTAQRYAEDKASGATPKVPTGPNLHAYLELEDMPAALRGAFGVGRITHGELLRRLNQDADDDDEFIPVDTFDLCPERRCDLIYLYPFELAPEDWLYLVHGVVGSDRVYGEFQFTEQLAVATGGVFAALFLLVSFLVIRSIYGPLKKLERWSATLGTASSEPPLPGLRFQELDSLATRLRFAFERVQESVEKEKLFLRHASHELRTPISILSANVELMDRLTDRPERSEAEQASLLRQYRALDDIQQLTETLLWINRQSESIPQSETIDLGSELNALIDNYRYLLEGRPVTVTVDGSSEEILAPAGAVRIVLSNLLRNAFQYTVDGRVQISLGPRQVRIENTNAANADEDERAHGDQDYGFGLGLELVALICKRFEWRCETSALPFGRVTVVSF